MTHASTSETAAPVHLPSASPTVSAPPVVPFAPPAWITTMFPQVAQRYANITIAQPQSRNVRIAFSPPVTSAPMFSGVSIPRSARIANEKNVRFAGRPSASSSPWKGFHPVPKSVDDPLPFSSHQTPANPIRKITAA